MSLYHKKPLILASGSPARAGMLENAGMKFEKIPADIDEDAIIQSSGETPEKLALKLAQEKALHVSKQNLDTYVIGSDQILEQGGQLYQKAKTIDEAREKLKNLRGKIHHLTSAVAIAKNNEIIWHATDTASLTMHNFDDEMLEQYMAQAKDDILTCVGAYAFESHGAWLFKEIDGNYFTILGMPLLPLLAFLRDETL